MYIYIYIPSNDMMMSEQPIGIHVQGNCGGYFKFELWTSLRGTEEYHKITRLFLLRCQTTSSMTLTVC